MTYVQRTRDENAIDGCHLIAFNPEEKRGRRELKPRCTECSSFLNECSCSTNGLSFSSSKRKIKHKEKAAADSSLEADHEDEHSKETNFIMDVMCPRNETRGGDEVDKEQADSHYDDMNYGDGDDYDDDNDIDDESYEESDDEDDCLSESEIKFPGEDDSVDSRRRVGSNELVPCVEQRDRRIVLSDDDEEDKSSHQQIECDRDRKTASWQPRQMQPADRSHQNATLSSSSTIGPISKLSPHSATQLSASGTALHSDVSSTQSSSSSTPAAFSSSLITSSSGLSDKMTPMQDFLHDQIIPRAKQHAESNLSDGVHAFKFDKDVKKKLKKLSLKEAKQFISLTSDLAEKVFKKFSYLIASANGIEEKLKRLLKGQFDASELEQAYCDYDVEYNKLSKRFLLLYDMTEVVSFDTFRFIVSTKEDDLLNEDMQNDEQRTRFSELHSRWLERYIRGHH